jgi:hypothetical protein
VKGRLYQNSCQEDQPEACSFNDKYIKIKSACPKPLYHVMTTWTMPQDLIESERMKDG